jgi:hypothetical protein
MDTTIFKQGPEVVKFMEDSQIRQAEERAKKQFVDPKTSQRVSKFRPLRKPSRVPGMPKHDAGVMPKTSESTIITRDK